MANNKPEPCRIDGLLAVEAQQVVIFRRGPTRQVQMLLWDLGTDQVTPGQWMKTLVQTPLCSVSPDGRHVLIGAFDWSNRRHKRRTQTGDEFDNARWTAISRPPFFTALALWFVGGPSDFGGGVWNSNQSVSLNLWEPTVPALAPPKSLKVRVEGYWGTAGENGLMPQRLHQQGWRLHQTATPTPRTVRRTYVKAFSAGWLYRVCENGQEEYGVRDPSGGLVRNWQVPKHHTHFLEVDQLGRIIFSEEGCLWAWSDFPNGEPTLIADLNRNQFENVEAQAWAQQW